MESDFKLSTELYNNQGEEYKEIHEYICNETEKGENIVNNFLKGINPIPTDKENDQEYLSESIMQLMYFKFNIEYTKEFFTSWHKEELKEKNEQFSESFYLKLANTTKYYHQLTEAAVFDHILKIILKIKLSENYNWEKGEDILKICRRYVGEKLLQAKRIKTMAGFE